MDDDAIERLETRGDLDAHAAEALRLMIRRLARQHGVTLVELTVGPDEGEGSA